MIDWLRSEFELLTGSTGPAENKRYYWALPLAYYSTWEITQEKKTTEWSSWMLFRLFLLNWITNTNAYFYKKKKRLGRIFAHYAWHKGLQMQWLEFLESTASYCLRICCKIQESRHWLMLFSSSGLDQWETDPMSRSQLSCQLHSWHKGTCEYHTISTFNPASNPIHLDLQSNKKWHPECCWL